MASLEIAPRVSMNSDLRVSTVRALSWSTLGRVVSQLLNVVVSVVLARLLSPREFGVMAMMAVVVGFAALYADMGFGSAIVQRMEIREAHRSSVFWLNLAGGAVLMIVFAAAAPLLAEFYGEPSLRLFTPVVALNFLLRALSVVPMSLLLRAMDFRRISIIEVFAVLSGGTCAVVMALAGFGVWSLVANSLVASVISLVLLWCLGDWRPLWLFDLSAVRDLAGFSLHLLGAQSLGYWARNLDELLIGKFLGSAPLGIYGRAYTFLLIPVFQISGTASRVLFPAFAQIQHDRERVRGLYLRVVRVIALITFPLMSGLFVTADRFVLAVFGSDWAEMIPLLRVFALLGVVQSIGTLVGLIYLSQGRADLQLRVSMVVHSAVAVGMIVGLRWGILGVAVGYASVSLIASYPAFLPAGKLIDLTYAKILYQLRPILLCSLGMVSAILAVGYAVPIEWNDAVVLGLEVATGVGVYLTLLVLFGVEAFRELCNLLQEQLGFRADRGVTATAKA